MTLRSPGALISLVVAMVVAGPATGAERLVGFWGNDAGCVFAKAGFQGRDDYIVLTAEGIETYGSGCRFAQQLTWAPGTQSLDATCSAEGEAGTTAETVVVTNKGEGGFFVTIPGLEEMGPLQPCS
ncbi:hypothetical protein X771_07470 [Mesorhizobium sp. LSJC277A00]|nr:hypothetical protein X771_07470 [Mesorhizobium sp. LSJC277A00]ESX28177.1 hypothetical protein X767_01880 [Mesorhizobium sp. LSJC264A00]ESX93380.1 hypothetical protein X754_11510 [Mesorhizobium sp. LNJC403B00]ESY04910.1 hypothetical protein X753_15950 [Mesorhizobium sp. LNJC399B00]ESY23643.1 hypothetical protein X750_11675 [Mesorhizobium sp. LNJC394B00]ESZ33591.1 hypothetical protein X733_15895 [Mesorhizobium sp. L2C067A000]ESZ52366.1 hypothetical protein X730_03265 [Mesorhizobium sp. L103C